MTELGPYSFIYGITKVGSFFRQNGVLAFRAFVFLKLTILIHNLGVIHGDQGEFAFTSVDDELRISWIFTFEDVHP